MAAGVCCGIALFWRQEQLEPCACARWLRGDFWYPSKLGSLQPSTHVVTVFFLFCR